MTTVELKPDSLKKLKAIKLKHKRTTGEHITNIQIVNNMIMDYKL